MEYKKIEIFESEDRSSRWEQYKSNISKSMKKHDKEKKCQAGPRVMSPHVISRWYRPPEVILRSATYNQNVDIWSLGCILYEMMMCTKSNVKKMNYTSEKRVAFKGRSFSPAAKTEFDMKD